MLHSNLYRCRRHELVVLASHPSGVAVTLCPACAASAYFPAWATMRRMPDAVLAPEGTAHRCVDCGSNWYSGDGWTPHDGRGLRPVECRIDGVGWMVTAADGVAIRPASEREHKLASGRKAGEIWCPLIGC